MTNLANESRTTGTRPRRATLWLLVMAVALAVFMANYLFTRYLDGETAWVRGLAQDVAVKSQQLAVRANDAASGRRGALAQMRETKDALAADMRQLEFGNPQYPGLAGAQGEGASVQRMADAWSQIESNADMILRSEIALQSLAGLAPDRRILLTAELATARRGAAKDITKGSDAMLAGAADLSDVLAKMPMRRLFPSTYVAFLSSALALWAFVFLSYARRRAMREALSARRGG